MKLFILLFTCLLAQANPDASDILQKADRARGGLSDGLSWHLQMLNSGDSQATEMEVKVKGVNVLALCSAPARQKGETYLFNDRNLWIYKPGLKKPISLSPRQRLSGQAANGDIATTNYARDYSAQMLGQELVNGKQTYKLLLKAKEKNVTYDQIRYWITKDTFLGVKAEFLTLEGKIFKSADFEYNNSIPVSKTKTPFISKMSIRDAAFTKQETIISYSLPKAEKISDSLFNVNNLAR